MIELTFPVYGECLPVDHGYGLYSALIHHCGELKSIPWQLGTISGRKYSRGLIRLQDHSCLRIRCHKQDISKFLVEDLKVGIHSLKLGIPRIDSLPLASVLSSRIVTIKGAETEEQFTESIMRQTSQRGMTGIIFLGKRQAIKIKRYHVVGYGVTIHTTTPKQLLVEGLGGKQKMGCGVFFPLSTKKDKML